MSKSLAVAIRISSVYLLFLFFKCHDPVVQISQYILMEYTAKQTHHQ
jgi:hypothetical protein